VINVTANTEKLREAVEDAGRKIRRIDYTQVWPAGYSLHQLPPDWESRLWDLTSKLAVKMADRCQEGLMTPEEFGKLSHLMAAWTVSASVEASRPKPPSIEELQKLFGGAKK
jgi:hypothetical protein